MYETPQYLTPDGYRRMARNPYRKKLEESYDKPVDGPGALKKKKLLTAGTAQKHAKRRQLELSDKAALLIAQALKEMLKK